MPRKKTEEKKQQEAYAKKLDANFSRCPFCGSENVNAGDHDGDRTVSFAVDCDDCGGEWTEHYRFVGGSDFRPGDKK